MKSKSHKVSDTPLLSLQSEHTVLNCDIEQMRELFPSNIVEGVVFGVQERLRAQKQTERRAFELGCAGGCRDGACLTDWLHAINNGSTSRSSQKRIVILGGGFAGVYAALRLEKLLSHRPEVEICLVSRDNFFLFTPMLHEIAASDLEITNIVNPLRKLLRRVKVFVGEVERINLPGRRVVVSHGHHNDDTHLHSLNYDHLVLALGSITNYFDLPGLDNFALSMKSLPDAIQLRTRIIHSLEEANAECSLGERPSLLTFVVAGGGFAGVETVAALNDFVREALLFYPNLHERMLRVVLVHPGAVILPELGESLGLYAQKVLAQRGVEIRLNARVAGMTKNEVFLKVGSPIPSSTLIWTAGTMPNPLLSLLPCQKECGRVLVNQFLQVPDWPEVWAVGDCAFVPDVRQPGKSHPPTAQHAIREGRVVAQNVALALSGRPPKPFSFKTIGLLASLGHRTGVARILGLNFSGFFAWWLWRTIYLSKLPGFDKKVRVAFEWTLDLLFRKDVCAVHDLPSRNSVQRHEHRQEMVVNEDQYRQTAEVEGTFASGADIQIPDDKLFVER
jgi:NADH dehydrogenase